MHAVDTHGAESNRQTQAVAVDYNEALVLSLAKQSVAPWPTCWIVTRVVCDSLLLRLVSFLCWLFPSLSELLFISGHTVELSRCVSTFTFFPLRVGFVIFRCCAFRWSIAATDRRWAASAEPMLWASTSIVNQHAAASLFSRVHSASHESKVVHAPPKLP